MTAVTKAAIRYAINLIYDLVVIEPTAGIESDDLRKVCWALDILRTVVGDETAYEVKYGTKPQFEVTVKNFED